MSLGRKFFDCNMAFAGAAFAKISIAVLYFQYREQAPSPAAIYRMNSRGRPHLRPPVCMTAIWPVGPPKLMKPSLTQNRKALPKVGESWGVILSPIPDVFPARVSLEVDDTFFSACLYGECIEIRHRISLGPEAHIAG